MGAFDDIVTALWRAAGQGAPRLSGRAATLAVEGVEIRLTDRGHHVLARAVACPLAPPGPDRAAQTRAALQLSLGSLKRHPVVIHAKHIDGRQVILVEQTIPYGSGSTTDVKGSILHFMKICNAIKAQSSHDDDIARDAMLQDYAGADDLEDEKSLGNEIHFRI